MSTTTPPNRQTQRTQTALKDAFVALLQISNYENITVEDIADRANIGRSTFYRHYNSKPDILLSWHEDIFKRLEVGQFTRAEWIEEIPPVKFTQFLEYIKNSRMPLHNFGKDEAYVLRKIGGIFTQQIEKNLTESFPSAHLSIPLLVLAQSIAGIYIWVFQWWIMETPQYSSAEMAIYVHRIIRGVIKNAMAAAV